MNLTDSHCHLYADDFDTDRKEVMQRAELEGVERFYLPGIDSSITAAMLQMEKDYPGKCFAMAGLHPCSVKENYEEELRMIEALLLQRKFSAIGETGLDFYWDKTFAEQQYDSFTRQIHLAIQCSIPVVIHSRESMQESIDTIQRQYTTGLRGIFHCFNGNAEQAKQIMELGFYMGIGGVVTFKNSGLDAVVRNIPLEHIVLETDAPYLAPVPYRGKRNESSYLKYVAEKIASIKNISVEEVAEVTTQNARNVFG